MQGRLPGQMWICLCILQYPVLAILRRSAVSQPCGLPPGYNQMSDFAKAKLQNIWENYKPGASCFAEQIATDVILTIVDNFFTKYGREDTKNGTFLSFSTTSPLPAPQNIQYSTSSSRNPVQYVVKQRAGENSNEKNSTTAQFFTIKSNLTSNDVHQHPPYLIPLYSTPLQMLASNIIPSKSYRKRNEPERTNPTEDSIYELTYTDDDIVNPKITLEKSSEINSSRHGYNLTENLVSRTAADEAVYDEVPTLEISGIPEFLKDANTNVIDSFMEVWSDPNIPSESLRKEMIHLLAVSLLTTEQLTAYNHYMNERRRCQRQLLLQMRQMSDEAQKALNILAYADPDEQFEIAMNFPNDIRHELKNFAQRRTGKCI
uniref:Uncharacterized protein n=1 Tax=Setaria digitata TaxID=48799 RepID=A0A915PIX3_9BILA